MLNVLNVNEMQEESKMSRLMKDERGMTLVELLATVVILAIIAGIGVVAIGNVIQNSREDAAISEIQQATTAAQLYVSSENISTGTFRLKDVAAKGLIQITSNSWASTTDPGMEFKIQSDGSLTATVEAKALKAGSKDSKDGTGLPDQTISEINGMKRTTLFP